MKIATVGLDLAKTLFQVRSVGFRGRQRGKQRFCWLHGNVRCLGSLLGIQPYATSDKGDRAERDEEVDAVRTNFCNQALATVGA